MAEDITRDLADLAPNERYKLMTGTIVPRPIAWVTTRDDQGRANAAPFSFFNAVSATPPVIALGIAAREGADGLTVKDTFANIEANPDFVVNLVDEDHAEAMNVTAIDAPPAVDETVLAGLELTRALDVDAPRILTAPVSFECRLRQIVELGDVAGARRAVVLADVLRIHARAGILDPETLRVDTETYRPVGRLFGPLYARQHDRFKLARPDYSAWVAEQQGGARGES